MEYNIARRKGIFDYPDNLKKAMEILKYGKEKLNLVGSSNIKSLLYFGDFDFMTLIKDRKEPKKSYEEFDRILEDAKKTDFLIFQELKIQLKDGTKIREKISESKFIEIFKNIDFVKFDFILYADYIFYELSSLYSFTNNSVNKDENIKRLYDELPELKKEKKYFKLLKRIYSISNLKNEILDVRDLTKFFNNNGLGYRIMSNLEAIEKLYEISDSKLNLHRIKENLKILKIPEKDISKNIQKLKESLTKKAKDFYDSNYKKEY